MGNILACFGGQGKSGNSSSSRRRPPSKRKSLPCHQQQQQVYQQHHEFNGNSLVLLPTTFNNPSSPELTAVKNKPDDEHPGRLSSCAEENAPPLLTGACDDAPPSLHVIEQPCFKGSPAAAELPPSSSPKKKVSFDLNVKTYDHVPASGAAAEEEEEDVPEDAEEQQGEGALLVREEDRESGQKKQRDLGYLENNRYQNCAESDDDALFCDLEEDDVGDGYEDFDLEDDEDATNMQPQEEEEESFDSYFSLQMDKDRHRSHTEEEEQEEGKVEEPTSMSSSQDSKPFTPVAVKRASAESARDRSNYINSVLNPVENITQWKNVKAGSRKHHVQVKTPPLEKENINSPPGAVSHDSNPGKSLDLSSPRTAAASAATAKPEVSVDTSLSSWLTPTQAAAAAKASSRCSNSSCSFSQENSYRSNNNSYTSLEERPILGALTVDDIKRTVTSAASPSPRKSPNRSPDEMPIMGTVGSYWKHTDQEADSRFACWGSSDASAKGIPNSNSKYREDKRVNWHSSPFEVRLERALNKGSPAVPSAAAC